MSTVKMVLVNTLFSETGCYHYLRYTYVIKIIGFFFLLNVV